MTDELNDGIEGAVRVVSEDGVEDEVEQDETVSPIQYQITSFGADYDAEGLVKRLDRDDIYIPPFQRSFVWTQKEASRFIESLLLGLPVPGIFLARDPETKKLLVIDGQQRLRSLQFFFGGYFNPDPEAKTRRVFTLQNVQEPFNGCTFSDLDDDMRIVLNDTIIHATIVKQESPEGEQTSIYHIFERLNTTGRKLSPQQIRVAIYHGTFLEVLHDMNNYEAWRGIFGPKSISLKDQELILRFLALYYGEDNYYKPMKDFMNKFTAVHRNRDDKFYANCRTLFQSTIDVAQQVIGEKVFQIAGRGLNAAVFDSVMVGLAKRLAKGELTAHERFRSRYSELIKDKEYLEAVFYATSNEKTVARRIAKATEYFADI